MVGWEPPQTSIVFEPGSRFFAEDWVRPVLMLFGIDRRKRRWCHGNGNGNGFSVWVWGDLGEERVGGRRADAGRRMDEKGESVPFYTVGDQAGQKETALDLAAEIP